MKVLQRIVALLLLAACLLVGVPAHPAAAATAAGRYPVIFIPGIGGTELYNKNELLWINAGHLAGSQLPILSLFHMNWLLPLRLAANGASPYSGGSVIHTGDIMRNGQTDIYSGLLASLRAQGYVEGKDLAVLPYDWRLELADATARLDRQVDQVLARTGARQVVLIGHSMGGLVARNCVVSGGAPKVKASIALATPFLGSPYAYRALEFGWDMGLKLPGTRWSAVAPGDVKLLVQNYPSVYTLAPAGQYWDWYPDGYLTRGGINLTHDQALERGMAPHNAPLARREPGFHSRLLDGSSHGVMQFVLAGNGRQTLSGIAERKDWLGMTLKTERYADGDEVVPLSSADLGYSKDPAKAATYMGKLTAVAYAGEAHTHFTQSEAVQDTVRTWLTSINGR